MSHIQYTIRRSGTYYFNRRVPKHVEQAYGKFPRVALSKDPDEAEAYAQRLNTVLEGSWAGNAQITPVDATAIV